MDNVDVHRLHFAFTIIYHYIFPQLTMGLALLILVLKTLALRGDTAAGEGARFWTKIFAVTFVMGVVTGIPMEFQFGTNWSRFAEAAGGVIFPALAIISIISVPLLLKKSRPRMAFRASAVYLASMVASAAVGIYPYALPARDSALGITVVDAAASSEGLRAALYWWVPGMILVCGYTYVVSYRSMPERFRLREASDGADHPR